MGSGADGIVYTESGKSSVEIAAVHWPLDVGTAARIQHDSVYAHIDRVDVRITVAGIGAVGCWYHIKSRRIGCWSFRITILQGLGRRDRITKTLIFLGIWKQWSAKCAEMRGLARFSSPKTARSVATVAAQRGNLQAAMRRGAERYAGSASRASRSARPAASRQSIRSATMHIYSNMPCRVRTLRQLCCHFFLLWPRPSPARRPSSHPVPG